VKAPIAHILSLIYVQGYEFYVVWIYVGVAILACSFGVAFWVGRCFRKNHFPVVW